MRVHGSEQDRWYQHGYTEGLKEALRVQRGSPLYDCPPRPFVPFLPVARPVEKSCLCCGWPDEDRAVVDRSGAVVCRLCRDAGTAARTEWRAKQTNTPPPDAASGSRED